MGRLSLAGAGAVDLIQRVFTNNADTMKDMQVRYGLVCNDQGGIRDDILVYRWPYGWAMVVNASNRDKIVAWLAESKGSLAVEVQDQTRDTCMVAVQGPKAVDLCRGMFAADGAQLGYYFATPTTYQGHPCVISRTGYTGEDGLEVMISANLGVQLWEDLVRRGAKPCGLGARDTLRLEAAMPLYGHELSEEIDPFQASLDWAVKLDKGDFRGREALMRRKQDSTLRKRIGLELAGKRIAREGAVVRSGGKDVGIVTSGTLTPTLNKTIAMAYVDPAFVQPGTALAVDIRGKEEPAKVVPLPFYKRAKK
jgi:aminomethyltransferase